jgi:type IV pilus assembly protein PilA
MQKQNGFSLIELLIVVAIILIIAAIAIPTLTRARVAADESSAVGSLRTINTAEISYNAAYPAVGFATNLTYLGGTATPCIPGTGSGCFIDSILSAANPSSKSGYTFTSGNGSCAAATPVNCYSVTATPQFAAYTGAKSFCSFEDAVVRSSTVALTNPCVASTAPIQ